MLQQLAQQSCICTDWLGRAMPIWFSVLEVSTSSDFCLASGVSQSAPCMAVAGRVATLRGMRVLGAGRDLKAQIVLCRRVEA